MGIAQERFEAVEQSATEGTGVAYIDRILAEELLGDENHEAASFIHYLSVAARHGHLCVFVEQGRCLPHPRELGLTDEHWEESIVQGEALLDPELCDEVTDVSYKGSMAPIVRWNKTYYLQRNWLCEASIVQEVRRLLCAKVRSFCNGSSAQEEILATLSPQQREAVEKSAASGFSVISGGPGTGKTYTAGAFVNTWLSALSDERRSGASIVITAPTGKAAMQLKGSLLRFLPDNPGVRICIGTLHSMLGRDLSENKVVDADLIVVDEASMIDAKMMALLLSSVRSTARLLVLGDPWQLPPVEIGAVFYDLYHALDELSAPALHKLYANQRTDKQELLNLAAAIQQGDYPALQKSLSGSSSIRWEESNLANERREKVYQRLFAEYLRALDDGVSFCILSPLRRGQFGAEGVNAFFSDAFRERQAKSIPIVITKNSPSLGLCNGELGELHLEEEKAYFSSIEEEDLFFVKELGKRQIPLSLLPSYSPAFALSVHKSQGSEFERVILLLPEGSQSFGRELLYTAVTRTKQELLIVGESAILEQALKTVSYRFSALVQLGLG